jgi:hypothetical protein
MPIDPIVTTARELRDRRAWAVPFRVRRWLFRQPSEGPHVELLDI